MEFTDSYVDGFCKTAAEFGIDPEALCKSAGVPNMYRLARLGKTILNTGSKYIPRAGLGSDNGALGTLGHLARQSTESPVLSMELAGPRTSLHRLINSMRAARLRDADDYFTSAFPNGVPQQYRSVLDGLRSVLLKRPGAQAVYENPRGSWTEGFGGVGRALKAEGQKRSIPMPAWVEGTK